MPAHEHHGPNGRTVQHNHNHGDVRHDHGSLSPAHAWTWQPGAVTWHAHGTVAAIASLRGWEAAIWGTGEVPAFRWNVHAPGAQWPAREGSADDMDAAKADAAAALIAASTGNQR